MGAGTEVVVTLGGRQHSGVVAKDHGTLLTVTCAGRMIVTAPCYVMEV